MWGGKRLYECALDIDSFLREVHSDQDGPWATRTP